MLLGVHSSRLDVVNRDASQDESLDLNCAWYADILMTLTQAPLCTVKDADANLRRAMAKELLADYPLSAARYDEMFAAPLEPREHWRPLLESLAAERAERMRERLLAVQRQVRENGVTYNVYADPQGADRPWELDVLPLIIAAGGMGRDRGGDRAARHAAQPHPGRRLRRAAPAEGRPAAAGAGVRPRRLPAPLPRRQAAPGDVMLHLYAADLARSPDGRWWVIDDRTQAPSGAGYALENRIVISRAFPELFRDLKVQRLASFFATLRDSLAHWAPQGGPAGGARCTVLLTPGPFNETYFEHAYLARYLGLPLVEGSDLTVRERCVWLKTLSGLKRVHVILRRLDDDYCDPLELRSDSALGVPGLVDAMRRGNVLVANALGSNLLESSTLLGFLPNLSRRILGQDLLMPSVATWWCGEPAALEDVIAKLDRLVIKSAFPQLRVEPMFGEDLDERGRKRVLGMLRSRPNDYVAQEIVQLAQAPVLDRAHPRLQARAIGLRVFACASPERLRRHARRPDARGERRRRARDLDAARRLEQGHLGAGRGAGQHLQPAAGARSGRRSWCAPAPTCRAAWSRTSTGSAATASAATPPRACCAWRWRGWWTTSRATTRARGR